MNTQLVATDQENLLDTARTEDLSDQQFLKCFAETERERDVILKLKGPGAHLLEGPRGVGKSSLMKKAELELDNEFHKSQVVGVYVSFKASLLVDAGNSELGYDPFLCWVAAKVLDGFLKKCRSLQFLTADEISNRYSRLFSVNLDSSASSLESLVRDLQTLTVAASPEMRKETVERLKAGKLAQFTNADSVADFVRGVITEHKLNRVNFLFDEAAHTFDEQQQEMFFQFFKLLHGNQIAVKAATYPGITSYGGNFELGHDAIRISMGGITENIGSAVESLRKHFRELLQKRVPGAMYGKLTKSGEALDLLILLSNGNTRVFLQTVSKWQSSGEFSKRSALSASNSYVASELTSYHSGLKSRLPRFSSHIDLGLSLIKAHIIPELQKKNEGKGDSPTLQTVYFTIDSLIPYKVQRALTLLEYSGFLYDKDVVKTAGRKQARRYALNLGIAANEKVFHSTFSRDPDRAIKLLSLTDYREFYASDDRFEELVASHPNTESCPNGHPRKADGAFCPVCGQKFGSDKIVDKLLSDPVANLDLTAFLIDTLTAKLGANVVGDVLRLTESQIRTAKWIGEIRAREIINAAEEYISG